MTSNLSVLLPLIAFAFKNTAASRSIFLSLDCKFIEGRDGDHMLNNRTGNYYMVADYSLKCYDSAYYGMTALAVAIVVFFSFGIPLFFVFILRRNRARLDHPDTKQYLGMLYLSYKPECYWFESVQMLFKLALWASLTFFKDDPQIKIAVAQFLCFLQVALHARLRPFNSEFKNTIQAFSVSLAFAVGFGGLIINYLRVSQREAFLLSNEALSEALQIKLDAFKIFMEIVLYCTIITYVIVATRRARNVASKNKDKVPDRLRVCCPCWNFEDSAEVVTISPGGGTPTTAPAAWAANGATQPNDGQPPTAIELVDRGAQRMSSAALSAGSPASIDKKEEEGQQQLRRSTSGRIIDLQGSVRNPMFGRLAKGGGSQ